ncbi:MAG TPA: VWA domain-containing protein [Bryobacteraceae bacterium]|nr:VWA domain-containing protein [Bryobacteraceae bacterium]
MTFAHPWLLLLVPLPALWAAYSWRSTSRKGALALKALSLAAILLALTQPSVDVAGTRMSVSVLVDTSQSIGEAGMSRASSIASSIQSRRGRHHVEIVPFASGTRALASGEKGSSLKLRRTAGAPGNGTDLENAIREALASAPAGLIPRLVLISDGRENQGGVVRAMWQARELGVPVDTYAVEGKSKPGIVLESVSVPSFAFTGDRVPVELTLDSPRAAAATVEVMAGGKVLGKSEVSLGAGRNQVRVYANLGAVGAIDFSGRVSSPDVGEVQFSQALTLRKPRVLYISQDPPGTDLHLMQALRAAEFDVQTAAGPAPRDLSEYQLVVFNNWDLDGIAPNRKEDIEKFVKEGGGVLVIGGERNIYREKEGPEDPLERSLPAKLAPPRSPEGTCVVLIVDKSSSMEGRKMELARLASIGVIENLRPTDMIGVLIFDNSFQWAVPIRRAQDRSLIKRLVAGITPDGGTQIAPALSEAYRRIQPVQATFKHIVLLTDGISEEGDSVSLAKEAGSQRVTISTVGLGQDVNRGYLEKVATFAKGKSYFLTDPSGLEQILLKDVMEHTGTTTVEKLIRPAVVKNAEILDRVGIETAPPLRGYVRFTAKPSAETILSVERADPLLVRWQYGLGRAAVFTSDAKSRWAEQWVSWNGYDRFWSNLFRDLLPHTQLGEAVVDYDRATRELIVDYRLAPHVPEPEQIPEIYAMGPEGFQRPVEVKKVAAGTYRGRVATGHRNGLFRLRPLAESRAFPEIGYYREEQELRDYGSDSFLLQEIARFTGGRFNPDPRDVFDASGRSIETSLRLWPGLLALALALNLAELILRKWRGIFQWR